MLKVNDMPDVLTCQGSKGVMHSCSFLSGRATRGGLLGHPLLLAPCPCCHAADGRPILSDLPLTISTLLQSP